MNTPATAPAGIPVRRGHLTLVHSTTTVPGEAADPRWQGPCRDVPPLAAGAAGLAVLLGGTLTTLALAGLTGPAWLPVTLAGIAASGLTALATITRVAFGSQR
jgi:hypothetical protein